MAPSLRACLVAAGPDAFATDVASTPAGSMQVVLWRGGAGIACHVSGKGRVGLEPRPDLAPPAPAAPAFFLDRRCADARRVDALDGTVLGWIAYPAC